MNLVRLGHYHTPVWPADTADSVEGECETALVVHVEDDDTHVNLQVFGHNGGSFFGEHVIVSPPRTDGAYSFHLSGDCPWKR